MPGAVDTSLKTLLRPQGGNLTRGTVKRFHEGRIGRGWRGWRREGGVGRRGRGRRRGPAGREAPPGRNKKPLLRFSKEALVRPVRKSEERRA